MKCGNEKMYEEFLT